MLRGHQISSSAHDTGKELMCTPMLSKYLKKRRHQRSTTNRSHPPLCFKDCTVWKWRTVCCIMMNQMQICAIQKLHMHWNGAECGSESHINIATCPKGSPLKKSENKCQWHSIWLRTVILNWTHRRLSLSSRWKCRAIQRLLLMCSTSFRMRTYSSFVNRSHEPFNSWKTFTITITSAIMVIRRSINCTVRACMKGPPAVSPS